MKKILLILFIISFQSGYCQFSIDFFSNPTQICPANSVAFTSFSQGSPATSWYWDFGDGDTSIVQNPIHFYSGGNYTVTLIASDGVDTDTITKLNYITVFNPIANFGSTSNGTTYNFIDSSNSINSTIVSWMWNFGDGDTSSLQNPFHTYTFPPDTCYDVSLSITDNNGCSYFLIKATYVCITNIPEFSASNIKLYPNPTSTHLTIEDINKPYNLTIYNAVGQLLYQEDVIKESSKKVDVSNYSKGILFIRIEIKDEVIYRKVLRQ